MELFSFKGTKEKVNAEKAVPAPRAYTDVASVAIPATNNGPGKSAEIVSASTAEVGGILPISVQYLAGEELAAESSTPAAKASTPQMADNTKFTNFWTNTRLGKALSYRVFKSKKADTVTSDGYSINSIIGFILGLLSVFIAGTTGVILAILAIIFSILGLITHRRGWFLAIGGLILGIIGLFKK